MATDLISRAAVLELIRLRVLNAWGNDRDAAERHGLEALAEQIKVMPNASAGQIDVTQMGGPVQKIDRPHSPAMFDKWKDEPVKLATVNCKHCGKENKYPAECTSVLPREIIWCGYCGRSIDI